MEGWSKRWVVGGCLNDYGKGSLGKKGREGPFTIVTTVKVPLLLLLLNVPFLSWSFRLQWLGTEIVYKSFSDPHHRHCPLFPILFQILSFFNEVLWTTDFPKHLLPRVTHIGDYHFCHSLKVECSTILNYRPLTWPHVYVYLTPTLIYLICSRVLLLHFPLLLVILVTLMSTMLRKDFKEFTTIQR